MRELHLFAGAGGGILGGILLGHTCVCAVEIEDYRRKILIERQRDGILPHFPIWDDIRTFDGRPWRGIVECVCGGFPCQDISIAGKGAGINGARSGLWKEMARVVCEIRPQYVFVENSPALSSRGLESVLGDISQMGFNARWGVFSACSIGAPHTRERMFILAYSMQTRSQMGGDSRKNPEDANAEQERVRLAKSLAPEWMECRTSAAFSGKVNGLANRVDRIEAIGDGQVPAVVKLAWETLMGSAT